MSTRAWLIVALAVICPAAATAGYVAGGAVAAHGGGFAPVLLSSYGVSYSVSRLLSWPVLRWAKRQG